MLLDVSSVNGLEIIQSNTGNQVHSLLGSIDYTLTKMGKRRLRNALLQPFKSKSFTFYILFMLMCVDVDSICNVNKLIKGMAENIARLQLFREALLNFPDVDSLVSGV